MVKPTYHETIVTKFYFFHKIGTHVPITTETTHNEWVAVAAQRIRLHQQASHCPHHCPDEDLQNHSPDFELSITALPSVLSLVVTIFVEAMLREALTPIWWRLGRPIWWGWASNLIPLFAVFQALVMLAWSEVTMVAIDSAQRTPIMFVCHCDPFRLVEHNPGIFPWQLGSLS